MTRQNPGKLRPGFHEGHSSATASHFTVGGLVAAVLVEQTPTLASRRTSALGTSVILRTTASWHLASHGLPTHGTTTSGGALARVTPAEVHELYVESSGSNRRVSEPRVTRSAPTSPTTSIAAAALTITIVNEET